MNLCIADIFTDSLAPLTGEERKAVEIAIRQSQEQSAISVSYGVRYVAELTVELESATGASSSPAAGNDRRCSTPRPKPKPRCTPMRAPPASSPVGRWSRRERAYKFGPSLELSYQDDLSAPIHEPSFKKAAGEALGHQASMAFPRSDGASFATD